MFGIADQDLVFDKTIVCLIQPKGYASQAYNDCLTSHHLPK